jgi:hypothetical protein
MPGIEIPVVPPGPLPRVVRVQVLDQAAGTITDTATGEVTAAPRVCAYIPSYACQCDDPAQCPVLREHPAEAAAAWAARQQAEQAADPQTLRVRLDGRDAEWERDEQAYMEGAPAAVAQPRNGRPVLLHSGNYGLYLTPAGTYHMVYQRTAGTNPDTGEVVAIDGAPQIHLRDLPEMAAQMVAALMDADAPLPPMIEAVIFGGQKIPRPVAAMMKAAGIDVSGLGADDAV